MTSAVRQLHASFQRLQIATPTPAARNSIAATITQYLPLQAVTVSLQALCARFQEAQTQEIRAKALQGRELQKLEIEIMRWKRRGERTCFRPSMTIRGALQKIEDLTALATFFAHPTFPLSRHERLELVVECCPNARIVDLSSCQQFDSKILQVVKKLPHLHQLNLANCQPYVRADFARLGELTTLHDLNLSGSTITDAELAPAIHPLQSLRVLNLKSCKHIKRNAVWRLYEKLPRLRLIFLENSSADLPWSRLNGLAVDLPYSKKFGLLSEDFFVSNLGKQIVADATDLSKLRNLKIDGRLHLIERVKEYKGYCRGYSYAYFISSLTKQPVNPLHVQFFQALEFLLHRTKAKLTAAEDDKVKKLKAAAVDMMKTLAGQQNNLSHERFCLAAASADFTKKLHDQIFLEKAIFIELKCAAKDAVLAHSIALSFRDDLCYVADTHQGIAVFENRQVLAANLDTYLAKFGTPKEPLQTVEGLVFYRK